jgi:phage tail protein X
LPFVLAGVPRTFASIVAAYQFMPGLIARVLLLPHTIATHLPPIGR